MSIFAPMIAENLRNALCGKRGITPQRRRNAWLGRQDSNLRMPVPKADLTHGFPRLWQRNGLSFHSQTSKAYRETSE